MPPAGAASRFVEGLAVGSTGGLVLATLAFFVANRLLPSGATLFGAAALRARDLGLLRRLAGELSPMPGARAGSAWIEQCYAAAALAVLAVMLNGMTTGDHIARALADGKAAVAGMDIVLLAGAAAAAVTAWRLQRRASGATHPRHHRHGLEGQSS